MSYKCKQNVIYFFVTMNKYSINMKFSEVTCFSALRVYCVAIQDVLLLMYSYMRSFKILNMTHYGSAAFCTL